MKTISIVCMVVCSALMLAGCGTPSLEAGYYDDDYGSSPAGAPASLFEMKFGAGGTEVTKNIPADAAHGVERAVKSMRAPSPADSTGE
jgi:hypothetical protein